MQDYFAGHSHLPTPHLVDGCPLCEATKTARNQAIEHLSEALRILAAISRQEVDRPTIRCNLSPIDLTSDDTLRCHSIDLTAKQAEVLSDAIDSVNAYASSQPPASTEPVVPYPAAVRASEDIPSGEWSAAAVAQCDPQLYADVTDVFLLIDPQSYLDEVFTARDPEAAAAAYEQLVTGEWDGEL